MKALHVVDRNVYLIKFGKYPSDTYSLDGYDFKPDSDQTIEVSDLSALKLKVKTQELKHYVGKDEEFPAVISKEEYHRIRNEYCALNDEFDIRSLSVEEFVEYTKLKSLYYNYSPEYDYKDEYRDITFEISVALYDTGSPFLTPNLVLNKSKPDFVTYNRTGYMSHVAIECCNKLGVDFTPGFNAPILAYAKVEGTYVFNDKLKIPQSLDTRTYSLEDAKIHMERDRKYIEECCYAGAAKKFPVLLDKIFAKDVIDALVKIKDYNEGVESKVSTLPMKRSLDVCIRELLARLQTYAAGNINLMIEQDNTNAG